MVRRRAKAPWYVDAPKAPSIQPKLARSASEGWLGVRDDFRNWFMHAA